MTDNQADVLRQTAADYLNWFGDDAIDEVAKELECARDAGDELSAGAWQDMLYKLVLLVKAEDARHWRR